MIDLGFMNRSQVDEVLEQMFKKPPGTKSPD